MSTFIEQGIALAAVAEATKMPAVKVEAEAQQLGLFVGQDWAGRPALSEWDAHMLVSGVARRQQESDRLWLQHREDTARWEAERRAAYLQAHAEAFREAGGAMAGRRADVAAEAAGDQAVARWEKRSPAPRWQGEQTASWWRRAAEVLTGAGQ